MKTTQEKLDKSFENMILSASGWRKVFAASADEEDFTKDISAEDSLICVAIADVFGKYLDKLEGQKILLARDARPTGPAICSIIYRTLVKFGFEVEYCGICSAPEIMAESAVRPFKGFIYVSASHNPVGHNGIKGGCNGGVFGQETAAVLIDDLKSCVKDVCRLSELYESGLSIPVKENTELKEQCLSDYRTFVLKTACPDGNFEPFI
ncbi:MAG: phosphoglucomutase, partial [Sphaerochaetaceae bacterium]|nr:phosphoglucomutase [Sphaerochaetaceae bacterium]